MSTTAVSRSARTAYECGTMSTLTQTDGSGAVLTSSPREPFCAKAKSCARDSASGPRASTTRRSRPCYVRHRCRLLQPPADPRASSADSSESDQIYRYSVKGLTAVHNRQTLITSHRMRARSWSFATGPSTSRRSLPSSTTRAVQRRASGPSLRWACCSTLQRSEACFCLTKARSVAAPRSSSWTECSCVNTKCPCVVYVREDVVRGLQIVVNEARGETLAGQSTRSC